MNMQRNEHKSDGKKTEEYESRINMNNTLIAKVRKATFK